MTDDACLAMTFLKLFFPGLVLCLLGAVVAAGAVTEKRPQVRIRGIYGGVPTQILERGKSLRGYGVNAIWIGSGGVTAERVALLKQQGAQVFAEFNTLHEAGYLKEHPDAAPVGADGKVAPPPSGWQGICPTHEAYRKYRMEAFRQVLNEHPLDGIWLDYHHSHASWEQATPELPDTCFCDRCLARFTRETGIRLPEESKPDVARWLLGKQRERWVAWRCGVFTDWVREFRAIVDEVRSPALLGTFHCPWSDTDYGGALREKLAIDLKAQAPNLDVFSPMPYHARFGHVADPAWISRQTAWLGRHLGIKAAPIRANQTQAGKPAPLRRTPQVWPIVQLSDWGEPVPPSQVRAVIDHGTRPPATGVMVFAWGSLHAQWEKVEAMGGCYREIAGG